MDEQPGSDLQAIILDSILRCEVEKRVIILAVVGLVSVVVALSLAFYFDPKVLGWKVIFAGIAELGFAALIAVFIIQTIDKHEKENFRKEIIRSHGALTEYGFSAYITGINVPDAILSRFGQIIGGDGIVKRRQTVEVDLERDGDEVRFNLRSEYIAYNASRFPAEFSVPLYADSAMRSVKLTISKKKEDGSWQKKADHNIEDTAKLAVPGGHFHSVETISLEPNEEVQVEVAFEGLKGESDSHLNSNTVNALSYELLVKYRPEQLELGARLTSAFGYDEDSEVGEGGWAELRLSQDTPFLKGSSAYIYWKPSEK